jgi:hypothetical protein
VHRRQRDQHERHTRHALVVASGGPRDHPSAWHRPGAAHRRCKTVDNFANPAQRSPANRKRQSRRNVRNPAGPPGRTAMPSPAVTAPSATHRSSWRWLQLVVIVGVLALASDLGITPSAGSPPVISGPYASLLAASTDLGPARDDHVQLIAGLNNQRRPDGLISWAGQHSLSVQWRPGDDWAVVEGTPAHVAQAFGVAVHDYRRQDGQEFYASPQQPQVPPTLGGEVNQLGRILSYTPHHESRPNIPALDMPDRGLTPAALRPTNNASTIALGGNAVDTAHPDYDLVSGLSTPGRRTS